MPPLFANTELLTTDPGFFPPNWWMGLIGSGIYFVLALVFIGVSWFVIDRITPGRLADELIGTGRPDGQPNKALGFVVGCMFLGLCVIIAAAIH